MVINPFRKCFSCGHKRFQHSKGCWAWVWVHDSDCGDYGESCTGSHKVSCLCPEFEHEGVVPSLALVQVHGVAIFLRARAWLRFLGRRVKVTHDDYCPNCKASKRLCYQEENSSRNINK